MSSKQESTPELAAQARSLIAGDRCAEALPILDDCIGRLGKTVGTSELEPLLDGCLRYFEKAKDAAGCRQTAVVREKLKLTSAEYLYDAACFRAISAAVLRATDKSPSAARQADADADRAMVWLRQAVATGYKDAAHIKEDQDLDSLRSREDFKKLVAELEAPQQRQTAKP